MCCWGCSGRARRTTSKSEVPIISDWRHSIESCQSIAFVSLRSCLRGSVPCSPRILL